MTKMTTKLTKLMILTVCIAGVFTGCSNQAPVPIYITPTFANTNSIEAVAQAVETDTQLPNASPTAENVSATIENIQIPTIINNALPTLTETSTSAPSTEVIASTTPLPNNATNTSVDVNAVLLPAATSKTISAMIWVMIIKFRCHFDRL